MNPKDEAKARKITKDYLEAQGVGDPEFFAFSGRKELLAKCLVEIDSLRDIVDGEHLALVLALEWWRSKVGPQAHGIPEMTAPFWLAQAYKRMWGIKYADSNQARGMLRAAAEWKAPAGPRRNSRIRKPKGCPLVFVTKGGSAHRLSDRGRDCGERRPEPSSRA